MQTVRRKQLTGHAVAASEGFKHARKIFINKYLAMSLQMLPRHATNFRAALFKKLHSI